MIRRSFAAVCGADYVRIISLSPEVMIFLFFMITDPKTVPAGRVGRVVFGVLVAVVSLLLAGLDQVLRGQAALACTVLVEIVQGGEGG